jgi:hypothetical protein
MNLEDIEDPNADLITVEKIAIQFNIDRTGARKWLIKEGFKFRRILLEENRNQLCLALTRRDAAEAIRRRVSFGFRVSP